MSPYTTRRLALAISLVALLSNPAFAGDKKAKKAKTDTEASVAPEPPAPEMASPAEPVPTTDAAAQSSANTITQNVAATSSFSTLLGAVKAAGLDTALSEPGPYTVFAPTNEGFTRLPKTALDTLMRPENKGILAKVLSHHVVKGSISAADLAAKIGAEGGAATLTTLSGQTLTAKMIGSNVVIADANGNAAKVVQADQPQSNGVIHAIDGILLPKPAK
jgi:uncharacterized surface protein with fasciclin (FAS1) repeats